MAFTRIVTALAEGRPFDLYGDGSVSRGFTYVADVVAATVAAMERAPTGAVYNVGGGAETTMNDAIALCERIAGRRLERADRARRLGRRPPHGRGHDAHPCRPRLGAGRRARGRPAAQWEWASARVAAG